MSKKLAVIWKLLCSPLRPRTYNITQNIHISSDASPETVAALNKMVLARI